MEIYTRCMTGYVGQRRPRRVNAIVPSTAGADQLAVRVAESIDQCVEPGRMVASSHPSGGVAVVDWGFTAA